MADDTPQYQRSCLTPLHHFWKVRLLNRLQLQVQFLTLLTNNKLASATNILARWPRKTGQESAIILHVEVTPETFHNSTRGDRIILYHSKPIFLAQARVLVESKEKFTTARTTNKSQGDIRVKKGVTLWPYTQRYKIRFCEVSSTMHFLHKRYETFVHSAWARHHSEKCSNAVVSPWWAIAMCWPSLKKRRNSSAVLLPFDCIVGILAKYTVAYGNSIIFALECTAGGQKNWTSWHTRSVRHSECRATQRAWRGRLISKGMPFLLVVSVAFSKTK